MRFVATADTDIGISKNTNQDSLIIKHATVDDKEILLAVVCDGMGGLAKGELASATVIRAFSAWFDDELPYELESLDMEIIGANKMISRSHCKICKSGSQYTITDLQSANGTYVNKVKLQPNQSFPINNGDIVRLANSDFQVTIG